MNFLVSGRISIVMSTFSVCGFSYGRSGNLFSAETFSVFGLSYGRSGNLISAEEGQNPIFDPLPRNEKLCGNL